MNEAQPAIQSFDINSFDAVAQADAGFEFELKGVDGKTGTGIFLIVVGRHSEVAVKWFANTVDSFSLAREMAARAGTPIEPVTYEKKRANDTAMAAVRVIGWRNVTQPFTPELMASALKRNPYWIDQIIGVSEDMANFMKAQ